MKSLNEYLREKYSSKGIYHYEDKIGKYLTYINSNGIQETQLDILNYIGFLREQNLHPKTIRNHLYSIKVYYNYLQKTGQRQDHPCKSLNLKDQINRAIQIESLYTSKQMIQFLTEHKTKQSFLQRRDEIIISLLIYQALTNAEIVNLEIKDVNLEEGKIYIKSEKGKAKNTNQSRTLALKPKQILLIDRYLNQDRPGLQNRSEIKTEKLLLTKYGKPIKPASINRQINHGHKKFMKMTPLKIRQSVIHQKLKEGNNVRLVQAFAGHRSILSTEAYQTNKLKELKVGINKFHPLQ
mgnify:CR=1 FL=1